MEKFQTLLGARDADPVELLYGSESGSGSRIRKSSIQIRIQIWIQGKTSHKIQFFKILWKTLYLLSDIEQQLYIKLARVPRGQLRSQKSCKVP